MGCFWSIGLFAIAYYGHSYIDYFFDAYAKVVSSFAGRTLVGMVIVPFGIAAYLLRNKNKILYGQLEIGFAAVSAVWIASRLRPEETLLSQWVGLTARV